MRWRARAANHPFANPGVSACELKKVDLEID
jgi:hypothetical protein